MSRKLATLRRVTEIAPIEGADLIELAIIDGWQCVVKKGEFQVGSLGVYFEIDSFLPATDARYKFLEPRFIKWQDKVGARIKSMKLKGQLSQGLLLPIRDFPEANFQLETAGLGVALGDDQSQAKIDEAIAEIDLTELLGIEKWEKPLPACLGGTARGNFPGFIPKTDQERVQNVRNLFQKWGEELFQVSTKMDGSSMSVYYVAKESQRFVQNAQPDAEGNLPDELSGVCSRNLDLVDVEGNQFWKTAHELQLIEKLRDLGLNICLQGELCGSGIQSNFEGFPEGFYNFYLFDVWDIDSQTYWGPPAVEALAVQFGIEHVPVHGYTYLADMAPNGTIQDLLVRAEGTGVNGRKREGIVFKHASSGFSFKAISNSYLLKHGE